MNEEPPSTSADSSRVGFRQKIKVRLREIYQYFSYKPKNKTELAGSIRDSSERGVLEKGTLNMIEGALRVSTDQVRDIMIPKPQMVFVDSEEQPTDFLPRVIRSSHSRFPVIDTENDKIYWFITSSAKDIIAEYNVTTSTALPVIVDTGNVLNFNVNNLITGVSILDGILYFTDNLSISRVYKTFVSKVLIGSFIASPISAIPAK